LKKDMKAIYFFAKEKDLAIEEKNTITLLDIPCFGRLYSKPSNKKQGELQANVIINNLFGTVSLVCWSKCLSYSRGKILSSGLEDIVDYGIGLSYRPCQAT
jgi:hypothetical protein